MKIGKYHLSEHIEKWKAMIPASIFFFCVIYFEELALKQYCFHEITLVGAWVTLLFTIPIAMICALICHLISSKHRQWMVVCLTIFLSGWMCTQMLYFRLFKTFFSIFSVSKMGMVASSFGDMVMGILIDHWFAILVVTIPVIASFCLRKHLIGNGLSQKHVGKLSWFLLTAALQFIILSLVLLCGGGGTMSIRDVYLRATAPILEVKHFGMMTETQLEIRRLIFDIDLEEFEQEPSVKPKPQPNPEPEPPSLIEYNQMDIDFDRLVTEAMAEKDEDLLAMHHYFENVTPTAKNEWTGRFAGKNLIWIVAEGFSSHVIDPVRTPTLSKLSNEGFQFTNMYTPLWGLSTSDGEYVTTTGLVPKSGVWSYSKSSENAMPFAFGNQLAQLGYTPRAYHNYLYTYYDRDKSYPNMGYDYTGVGNGLDMEDVWPASDLEMMEKILPEFIDEDPFMAYILTVSGHLNYTLEENAMSRRHWDTVKDLPYSDTVKCYLACQMEVELALSHLMAELELAGELDDTVIVLSSDHYPYGLTDEQYSELFGHPIEPSFERYENSLILWSGDMDEPVVIDKYASSLDILPTLSNLFGLPYDSRLMAGRDILSDSEGFVIFSDYSFISEYGSYNSDTDVFATWDGSVPDEEIVDALIREVQNRIAYSTAILEQDYYSIVFDEE